MLLSICIPTYNRVNQLDNCLNSIFISKKSVENFNFEVCISDNNSQQRIESLIEKYKNKLNIKFNKNIKNLGFALNGIKSVEMASGTYSWMIGDDDLFFIVNIFSANFCIFFSRIIISGFPDLIDIPMNIQGAANFRGY